MVKAYLRSIKKINSNKIPIKCDSKDVISKVFSFMKKKNSFNDYYTHPKVTYQGETGYIFKKNNKKNIYLFIYLFIF